MAQLVDSVNHTLQDQLAPEDMAVTERLRPLTVCARIPLGGGTMFARHCVRTLMIALLLCGGTACGTDGGTRAQKSSSCARFFTFEGREYRDVGDFPVEAGRRVGTAVQPACDQHGADGEKRGPDRAAYEVKGVAADVAIAVGDDPDDVEIFVSYDGTELPPGGAEAEDASR
ncbi:DUF6281 family protein [Streptomyces sp. MNU77]|uniref:DUF6281 family protein n=1 Tax=Streptomyces sp. MNU77 TaxID=1573406 RepID=UPI000AF9F974|nr:DUF6281 family protein [Streptomyces sp. MNU77]